MTAGIFAPPWRALTLGILAVVSLVAFEAMAVATAMPVAARELGGLRFYAWGFSAFLIASLVGMVVAGQVADRRGPVLPFLAAVTLFATGLVVAGLATSMGVFVAARAVQGLGGGLISVALYVVAGRLYPEEMRPRLFAAMSGAWVLPAIVGPSVAGLVADTWSWRWVFLAVPPLVVPAVALMLPRLRGLGPAPGRGEQLRLSRDRRVPTALVLAAAVAAVQYAGQLLDVWSLLLLAVGLPLILRSLPTLMPPGVFRVRRGLPTAVLMRGVLAGAFFGTETFLPLMLVQQRGLPTVLAGLALTVGAIGWSVGSWVQGRPGLSTPRHLLVQRGSALVAVGIVIVAAALWSPLPVVVAALGWAVAGTGMGLAMTTTNVLTLSLSPPAEQGANSSALQLSDALGSILLVGAGGAVYAALHRDQGRVTFLAIYLAMAVVAAVGAVLAGRIAVPAVKTPAQGVRDVPVPTTGERDTH